MNSNPALGLIGFWMMLQLAATLAILIGGIYALYCLGRASAGLDRMASAMEVWVEQQRAASTPSLPGSSTPTPLSTRIDSSALSSSAPGSILTSPAGNIASASTPIAPESSEQSTRITP
jgi:hypothetical protein